MSAARERLAALCERMAAPWYAAGQTLACAIDDVAWFGYWWLNEAAERLRNGRGDS